MRVFGKRSLLTHLVVMCAILFGAVGCDAVQTLIEEPTKPTSKGAAYELILVCDNDVWTSEVGDTLISILQRDVEMLNQREPYYRVFRILPAGFTHLNKEHRNVLYIDVDPQRYDTSLLIVRQDIYSTDQMILTASAPSISEMVTLLDGERENIVSAYEIAERRRNVAAYKKFGPKSLTALVQEKFGFTINFPAGFFLANQTKDFIWARYEMPKAGQGVLVYSYPYTGPQDLSEENIIAKRNKYAALIPGPNDGSYMSTYYAKSEAIRIDGRLWIRTRGFWDLINGYMGGPFISYTTIDTESNKVITIDGYVYSPELPKRNFLREMEHLVYTVEMGSTKATE